MPDVDFQLYLITDRRGTFGRPLHEVVEEALVGGVDAVQLREKDLSAAELFDLAIALRRLCHRHGARFLVNDRIDVALAVGADGVHLPVDSFTAADARKVLGPHALIGASTHDVGQARAALDGGADFIVFGPIFDTPSKRDFGPPVGLEALARVAVAVAIPVLAIGGIRADRVAVVRRHGARGIAAVSSILSSAAPRDEAAALRALLSAPLP